MSNAPGMLLAGRYWVEKWIDGGGYGEVYRAFDRQQNGWVALKKNKSTAADAAAWRQFEREAIFLMGVTHPNLPHVRDYFTTPDGGQYLVMDFVAGDSLATILDARGAPLSEAEAVGWIWQVCDALECLHSHVPPIVHRDVKPQNIIITPQNQAVLIDLGISKLHFSQASATTTGAKGVSSGYSPPEQYGVGHTDPRSDVYALGATLYTLLTGRVPDDSLELHFHRAVLVPARDYCQTLSAATEQAVTSAMRLEPNDRPQNIAQFRDLLFPPIRQQSTTALAKLEDQWPIALGVSVAFIALLCLVWFISRPDPKVKVAPPVMPPAPIGADNAAAVVEVRRWGNGVIYEFAYSPDGSRIAVASTMGVYIYDATTMAEMRRFTGVSSAFTSLAFAPDGQTIAAGLQDGRIYLLPAGGGQVGQPLAVHARWINSLIFTADGAMLVAASGDGSIRLWRTTDGSPVMILAENSVASQLALSPDGQVLAAATQDGSIRLWQIELGAPLRTLPAVTSPAQSIAFQPSNGGLLASGHDDGQVRLWQWANDAPPSRTLNASGYAVNSIAFTPDGASLVTGAADGQVRQWRVADGQEIRTYGAHTGPVNTLAFSPDGQRLASSSGDDTVRQWNAADGSPLNTAPGHGGWVHGVAFRPDGTTVVSAHGDGSVVLDSPDGVRLQLPTAHTGAARSIAVAPNGLIAASGGSDNTAVLWQLSDAQAVRSFIGHNGTVNSVAFSRDSATMATVSDDQTVRLWSVGDGWKIDARSLGSPGRVVTFAPNDDAVIAAALDDGSIWVWRWEEKVVTTIVTPRYPSPDPVRGLAFTAGGNELITIWDRQSVDMWTLPGGSLRTSKTLDASPTSLALSPNGQTLAIGSETGRIWLLRAADGTPLKDLDGHMGRVNSLAFSSDGTRLASGGADGTVRLWGVGQ